MKRLLLIFALLSAAGCSAFGQTYASTQCHSTSANSCAGSTISVTSGQTIVVGVVVSPTTSTMSVTDSSSNTYSVCTNGTTPAGPTTYLGSVSEVFCATAAATNASLTITIHGSGSINDLFGVMLSPSSGGLTTVDQVGITTASSGTAWTSASVTTTAASELLVGVCAGSYNGSGGTMTATSGSGYTLAQTYNGSGPSIGIEYQAVSSTGSYQAKITNSASTSYTCFIVTFEATITTLANPIPVYNAGATTSFTMPSGSTGCYTVDGSTPTATTPGTCSHGTSCSSSACTNISPSGLNTVQILATEAGYANSSVVTVQPDIPAASDNLQAYYNSNWRTTPTYLVGPSIPTTYAGIPFQNPLDCAWTACAWQTATSSGGEIYPENDPTLGGSNVDLVAWNNGTGNLIQSLRVAEGYNANQGALVYLHSNMIGTFGGPAVRCNASGSSCISLIFTGQTTSNLISLYKGTGASPSHLEYTSSSVTLSDGAFAELRAVGCVYTPLLNGSPISGLPAFTDAGCAQSGQPGVAMIGLTGSSTGLQTGIYAPSFYNIGGTSSGYTPPSVPTPTTYTDASLNTASIDMEPPGTSSWFHFDYYPSGGWIWGAPFTGTLVSGSNYAVGPASTSTQYEFLGVFGLNQWEAYTVNVAPWTSNLGWWLSTLLNQPWIYGSASGCNTAGTLTSCFDTLSYYLGITASNNYTCDASKDEYCHTPFVHGTKVTPAASPGNQVVTFAASPYTLLPGDLVETRYLNGYVEDWCKQGSSPASWAPSHTYAAGSWIEDSNGGVQYTASGGTSQSGTHPAWNGSWIGTGPTSYGETTTDGTVTWAWYGIICPTTTKYTHMIRVPDPDLGNPSLVPGGDYTHALGIGFPGLATYGGGPGLPVYNNWSAGTVGYGTGEPCAASGQCIETGFILSSGGIF